METLEFIIFPDGRVQETVTGIIGSSCAEVTAAIEEKLGQVTSIELTAEYFSQNNAQLNETSASQSIASQWS
ncbi:MAG: DUF2997 domain-containing protein [Cyanobacteria bacterium P01_F01_bin.42]